MTEPGRRRRTRPTREETRERVLTAAVELFFELGPTAATLERIASRAGLTKGAVYSSFENKDELFAATVERLPTTMYTDLLQGASSRADAARALRSFGAAAAGLAPPDPAVALLHELYALALRNPATRETIAAWVAANIEAAASQAPDPDEISFRVPYRDVWVVGQALLEALFLRRAINPELVSDELVATAMELLAGLVDE